ncbi:DUF2842 domain-containing protein [Flexibacterium corallicola]|uniref:DUF2842 domain-containing protein n=1 Tax=Flexibacterium corallicola TaxID=3037259 RepID=UPI00286ED6D2|nr:DUF2842 domain-containing protein [Pseudovibrio sp. M1P-2-3]
MSSSLRRFIGMVALVAFVIIYCFIAMVIGDMTMGQQHWAVQFSYFAIAGLIWVLPAAGIIKWMYKTSD